MDYIDIKNPLKSKRPKSFKFLQKKDKEEKEEKKEDKKKKDDKDDKKREKKKKEERKLREKEEKKKIKKEKKKKSSSDRGLEEDYTIFGVPLSIAVERNPSHDGIRLPAIVRECIDFVEEKGLHCEGIYRLGGMKNKVQSLRRAYNAGEIIFLGDQQPHVVASLLKQYLRELPETILTVDMMPHFEDVSLIPNPRERAEALRQLIDRLPTTNRLLLQYVLKHMGHVIEKEKDTKMSYHNVCVVLSPTMQISHRVLNVMFHSHQYLFGNIVIKKYHPPITSYSCAKRSIDDLKTLFDIEEEIQKQESLLASLHSAMAAGRICQKKEEQLWEAQRIVTLLKRKLKTVQRREMGDFQKNPSDSAPEKELSSEESQKEAIIMPPKLLESQRNGKIISDKGEGKKLSSTEAKSSSETDTTGTPSFKTLSNEQFSRISSEGESDRSQVSSLPVKKDEASKTENQKEQIIPILPKPLSARAERNKLAQANREKISSAETVSFASRKREDIPLTPEKVPSVSVNQKDSRNTLQKLNQQSSEISSKVMHVDVKKSSTGKEVIPKGNKLLNISENEVSHRNVKRNLPQQIGERIIVKPYYCPARKPRETRQFKPSQSLSEDCDYSSLLNEEVRLHMEHDELLSINQELTRKLQAEKSEISRLRDEIQEMQTLYGYRTHSYDSSESDGSESEGESDNEEKILKQIFLIDKSNKHMKNENANLIRRIQDERELIVQLRVALRQAHVAS